MYQLCRVILQYERHLSYGAEPSGLQQSDRSPYQRRRQRHEHPAYARSSCSVASHSSSRSCAPQRVIDVRRVVTSVEVLSTTNHTPHQATPLNLSLKANLTCVGTRRTEAIHLFGVIPLFVLLCTPSTRTTLSCNLNGAIRDSLNIRRRDAVHGVPIGRRPALLVMHDYGLTTTI